MKALLVAALTLAALPCTAQTTITPSQTRLLGCFGEAFTLVEHVWRLAPGHLDLVSRSAPPPFAAGVLASGTEVDQAGAMAVARNLDGCLADATAKTTPDATTAVLATAVRIELDSAIEDVAELIKQASARRDAVRTSVPSTTNDRSLDSPVDRYLAFGETIKNELVRLRGRVDALVTAATPRLTSRPQ